MLHEPKLLLLDEPTAGVDPKARRAFWDEIHSYAADGITVLVSTHYMDEAERCHEIAYIAYGELMARGTAEEIIRQSGLFAFIATGPGADRLAAKLRDAPGVSAAAAFGTTLACLRPRPRRTRTGHRAVSKRSQHRLAGGRADPRRHLHPPHGTGARQCTGSVKCMTQGSPLRSG